MQNKTFFTTLGPHTLSSIANKIHCNINNADSNLLIHDVKPLQSAHENSLTFLTNKKYISHFSSSNAAACLVPMDFDSEFTSNMILLKTENPYHSYSIIVDMFYEPRKKIKPFISPSAYIASDAIIGENCYLGHNVVVEEQVEIGNDCIIKSGSFIDYNVKIGNRARIDSNVSISHSIIGDDFVALAGACIGQDGFGFSTDQHGTHKKIYHIGRVLIGDNVEIGANSTIDRGSMHDTIIEDLCRIDNLVQVGHNAHIKQGTILVAQVGIAGSSIIGAYCTLGGQVGVSDHINIAEGVKIAAQGGVIKDINTAAAIMAGTPAIPIRDWHKQTVMIKKLIKGKDNGRRTSGNQ